MLHMPARYWIRGWATAEFARQPRYLKAHANRPAAWFVPPADLRPINKVVDLSAEQLAEAEACARHQHARVLAKGYRGTAGQSSDPEEMWAHRLVGLGGERAAYVWAGERWDCGMDRFTRPDLRGCEVRTAQRHDLSLIVRPTDTAARFIFVTCTL